MDPFAAAAWINHVFVTIHPSEACIILGRLTIYLTDCLTYYLRQDGNGPLLMVDCHES